MKLGFYNPDIGLSKDEKPCKAAVWDERRWVVELETMQEFADLIQEMKANGYFLRHSLEPLLCFDGDDTLMVIHSHYFGYY